MNIYETLLNALMDNWIGFLFVGLFVLARCEWSQNFYGEFKVNRLLSQIPKHDYRIIKNVIIPTQNSDEQTGHILISKYGVFVVEIKNMSGWIFGSADQSKWKQKIYRFNSEFENPIIKNDKRTKTLSSVLGVPLSQIHSVVVFIGDSTFKTEMPDNVIAGKEFLSYIQKFNNEIMDDSILDGLVSKIKITQIKLNSNSKITRKRHTAS